MQTKLIFGAKPYRDGELMEIKEDITPLKNLGWIAETDRIENIKGIINAYLEGGQ